MTSDEVKSAIEALERRVTELQKELAPGRDLSSKLDALLARIDDLLRKLHEVANHALTLTAAENKLVAVTEKQAGLIAGQARALYDMPNTIETDDARLLSEVRLKLDEVIVEVGVLVTDVRGAMQAHLGAVDRRMDEIRRMFVTIEKSAALAANDAGDAKDAANAARDNTDSHKLHAREENERVGLLKAFGQLRLSSQIVLAIILLAAIVAGLGGGHGLHLLGDERKPQHREALPAHEVKP